ncbi:MAG: hypothetical protein AAF449_12735 [Myxococcota bacterium]
MAALGNATPSYSKTQTISSSRRLAEFQNATKPFVILRPKIGDQPKLLSIHPSRENQPGETGAVTSSDSAPSHQIPDAAIRYLPLEISYQTVDRTSE